jgi:hypothetical protein
MQPFKYGQVIAMWLLRITLVLYLFLGNINNLRQISFDKIQFYISFGFVIFAVLLLVGGFLSKPGLTVISGLIIFLLSVYQLVISFGGRIDVSLVMYLFPLSIGFFFLCQGNK